MQTYLTAWSTKDWEEIFETLKHSSLLAIIQQRTPITKDPHPATIFIHNACICMIAQGTNGISGCFTLEGLSRGHGMLSFVPLNALAVEVHPTLTCGNKSEGTKKSLLCKLWAFQGAVSIMSNDVVCKVLQDEQGFGLS
eukprot:14425202-Ditylum_brightwellii.AAC.1